MNIQLKYYILLQIIFSNILLISSGEERAAKNPKINFRNIEEFPNTFSLYTNEYIKLDLTEYFEGLHLQIDHFTNTSLAEEGVVSFDPGVKILRKLEFNGYKQLIMESYLSPILINIKDITRLLWLFNVDKELRLYDISSYKDIKLLRIYNLEELLREKLDIESKDIEFLWLFCNKDALVNKMINSGYIITISCTMGYDNNIDYLMYLASISFKVNLKGKPMGVEITNSQYNNQEYGVGLLLSAMKVKKSSLLKVMLYSCKINIQSIYEEWNATSLYILDMNSDFDLAFSTLKGSILAVLSPDFFNKTNICLNDIFVKDNLIYTTDVLNSKLYVISVKPNTLEFELSTEIDLKHGGGKIIFAEFIGNEELVINCRNDTYGKSTVYQFRIEANKRFIETEVLGRPYELPNKTNSIGDLSAISNNYVIASYICMDNNYAVSTPTEEFIRIYQRNTNQFRSNVYDIGIDKNSSCRNIHTYDLYEDIILITDIYSISFVHLTQPSFVINTFDLSFPILDAYSKTPIDCSFYVKNDINNYIYQNCQLYLVNQKTNPFYRLYGLYEIYKFQGVSSTFLVQNLFKGKFESLSLLQIGGEPGINIKQKYLIELKKSYDMPENMTEELITYSYIYESEANYKFMFFGNISTIVNNCFLFYPKLDFLLPECNNPNTEPIIIPISKSLNAELESRRMNIIEHNVGELLVKLQLISDGLYNLYVYALYINTLNAKLSLQFYPSDILFSLKYLINPEQLFFFLGKTEMGEGVLYIMGGDMIGNGYFNLALKNRIVFGYEEIPIELHYMFNKIYILFENQRMKIYVLGTYAQPKLTYKFSDFNPIGFYLNTKNKHIIVISRNGFEFYDVFNEDMWLINNYNIPDWTLYVYENKPLLTLDYHIIGIYYKPSKIGYVYQLKLFTVFRTLQERYTFEAGHFSLNIKSGEIICKIQLVNGVDLYILTNLRLIHLEYRYIGNRLVISSGREMSDKTRTSTYMVYPNSPEIYNPNSNITDIPSLFLFIKDQPSNMLITPAFPAHRNNQDFVKLLQSGDILLDTYIAGFNMSFNLTDALTHTQEKNLEIKYGVLGVGENQFISRNIPIINILLLKSRQELHIFDKLGVTIYTLEKEKEQIIKRYKATCLYNIEFGDIQDLKPIIAGENIYILVVSTASNGIQLLQILYFDREALAYNLRYSKTTPINFKIEVANNKAGMFYSPNALTFSMHIFLAKPGGETEYQINELNNTLPYSTIFDAKVSRILKLPVLYILYPNGISIINYDTSQILKIYEFADFVFNITFEEAIPNAHFLIVSSIQDYEEQLIVVCSNQIFLEFVFQFSNESESVKVISVQTTPRYGEEGTVMYLQTDATISMIALYNSESRLQYVKFIRLVCPPNSRVSTTVEISIYDTISGIDISEEFFNSTGIYFLMNKHLLTFMELAPHPFLQVPNTFSNHPHMITIDAYNKFSSYSFNLTIKSNIFVKQSFYTILLVFICLGVLVGVWVGWGIYKKKKRKRKVKRLQSMNIDLLQKGQGQRVENEIKDMKDTNSIE